MASNQDKEALEVFQQLDAKLSAIPAAAGAAAGPADFCKTYSGARPLLQTALKFIGFIPGYGGTIVSAIQLLMQIADSACKINS